MPDTQEDLNTSQSVADPDLTASGQGADLNAPGQGEKLADGDDKDKKTVKYVEFEKANKKAAVAEEDARVLREQMQIMTANQQQAAAPVQTQTQTIYDQARADLGLQNQEYPSESEVGTIIQRTIEIQNAANLQQQQAVSNQRFVQEHADYGEVVGRQMGNNFQLSPELLKIITEKPHLANAAYSNAESAYKVVMDERKLAELEKNAAANQEHLKRQGIDNKTEPLGGSAAGGGGAGDPNNQQMMSREQIKEIRQKMAEGERV
ncbi:hypothetical protein LCGC14_1397410 [marine sediment metagenome]|uniref:Uncharacterized protein n=1 Tax=marine sediment metagenome TaxID=412755 RepID=A0A0F9MZP7_9ZZZZ